MVNFLDLIGEFPANQAAQQSYFDQLVAALNERYTELESNESKVVYVSQTVVPSQARWESEYQLQTNRPLPISPSAILIWYDSSQSTLGGIYGTVSGLSTVVRREHFAPLGAIILQDRNSRADAFSITTGIAANSSRMPVLTFTTRAKITLEINFEMYVSVAAAEQWGIDLLLNGIKLGTQDYGCPPDYGILNRSGSGFARLTHIIPGLLPGTYILQSMFGLTGTSTGTLTIGGTSGATGWGARTLHIRGVAV
jgi:hypothetical protein